MARDWTTATSESVLHQVRAICTAFPEIVERPSHGAPAWFVRGKRTVASFVDDHHGDGHLGVWCAAPPGAQELLIESAPHRFYRPAYVGHRGWVGVDLAVDPDWDEAREILADAYRCTAPVSLAKLLP
ncbi:MAG: MmcQ/YjbR family DNA-binding protein [Acidimicrobiales bacterium]